MLFDGMSPVRKWLSIAAAFLVVLIGIAASSAVSNYFERRDQSRAATAEYWRREHLTPEQRISEDAAKAKAAKAAAEAAQVAAAENERKVVLENGRRACLAAWHAVLNDPGSANLDSFEGVVLSNNEFQGEIIGRAKNVFGGYVRTNWWCHGVRTGTDVRVLTMKQGAR